MSTKALLTIQETSDLTGIAVSTLYKWHRAGKIPARKIGRQVRFVPKEIDAWINGSKRSGQ